MEISNSSINPSSIVDILTLRYDPSINPNLPKKTWKDFEPIEKPVNPVSIENSICTEIEKKLTDEQEISIALSAGVDSTLILSLLRKTKPDVKINAISIKFANSIDETPVASKIAE